MFVKDVTLPDNTIVSPSQPLIKTWRLQNTGTSTWDASYKLVFVDGEQMQAPLETALSGTTAPNATADISINLVAPNPLNDHTGYFQLRNPQGTYFGPRIWVKIKVQQNSPAGHITSFDITPASPSQASSVHLLGRAAWFPEFRSMRFVIGNQSIEKPNFRQVGDQIEISTDWDTSALARGNYTISLETAKNGDNSWSSPERQMQTYTLTGTPVSSNRPPDRPILLSPYNWFLQDSGGSSAGVTLCVQPTTDPDGNPVSYQFEVNGGAITSGLTGTCWTNTFDPGTYTWHARSSDGSLYSDWSADNWNFTVAKGGVYIGGVSLYNQYTGDTHICVPITYDGINAPDVYAWMNLATDGSQNGAWKLLDHYGPNASPDCTQSNVHGWWIRSYDYETGTHVIKVNAVKKDSGANETRTDYSYTIPFLQPRSPELVAPSTNANNGTWWNSTSITFQWNPVSRVDTYTLIVSTTYDHPLDDPAPLLSVPLNSSTTSYTYDFGQDYPKLYWAIKASNSAGASDTGGGVWFGIDRISPQCFIEPLPSVLYDNFQVKWSGTDDSAGIRSYNIQVSDTNRDIWRDWLLNQPQSKQYELFIGQPGHTYFFRCQVTDNAGNTSDYPATADTFTKIDPTARPPEPWWNTGYTIKRTISIQNNMPSATLPADYPVNVRFTTGTPVSSVDIFNASQSINKCDDIRIVYNNSTEINRYINKCTSDEIDIWFRSLAAISGGGTDDTYQIYVGNPNAVNPPADASQIWYPSRESDTTNLYLFQEGSGSITNDFSGNGRNCTINPTVAWSTGKWGSGLQFNRANNGDTVSLLCGSPYPLYAFTAEFWYKPGAGDLGARVAGQLGPNNQLSWLLSIEGDRMKFERWCNGGSQQAQGDINFRNSPYFTQWNYLAVTFDGGSQVKFYVNGNLDKAVTLNNSCSATFNIPLEIGSVEGGGQGEYSIGAFRLSNSVKTNFYPGSLVGITNEPSVATGTIIYPPASGSPDLAILSVNAYPNSSGGILVEAVVQNQGTLSTTNGFFTDLYVNHVPTGSGDYTGSLQFWVNDPIPAGGSATLTTVVPSLPGGLAVMAGGITETTATLYAQADSTGALSEADKSNNISTGTDVCVASADLYEPNDTPAQAASLAMDQAQTNNFDKPGDSDWMSFNAVKGKLYNISTSNLGSAADTYLYLYGTDGTTLLASNDDYNDSLASQILWTAPDDGAYYVLVKHWNPNDAGCGTSYDISVDEQNPVPEITTLDPTEAAGGSGGFTLTVNGSDFIDGAVVQWESTDLVTTYVSDTQVTAAVPGSLAASAGTFNISVVNPAPGGGSSNTAPFTVNNPTPAITTIDPSSAAAGSSDFTLTVNGTNFVSGSVVRWKGTNRATTYISDMQLTIAVSAGDISTAGSIPVNVFNPAPGGGTSTAVNFIVQKATPAITWADPADIVYGTPLSVTQLNATANVPGTFVYTPPAGAVLSAGGGQALKVDFTPTDSANYATATKTIYINVIKATPILTWADPADIMYGTSLSVTQLNATANVPGTFVYTPPAGTVLSAGGGQALKVDFTPTDSRNYEVAAKTIYITVNNPVPMITSFDTPSVTAGSPDFLLTINGSGFVNGSVVQWNGEDCATTYVSANQLTVEVSAAYIAAAGNIPVTVTNPTPGGGTSNTVNFTIAAPPNYPVYIPFLRK